MEAVWWPGCRDEDALREWIFWRLFRASVQSACGMMQFVNNQVRGAFAMHFGVDGKLGSSQWDDDMGLMILWSLNRIISINRTMKLLNSCPSNECFFLRNQNALLPNLGLVFS